MDTWVRGIATGSDGWLLLFFEFLSAVTFEEFVRLVIAPFVGYTYSIAVNLTRQIEIFLTDFIYREFQGEGTEQHWIIKLLENMERVSMKLRVFENLKVIDAKMPPPPTWRRKRPAKDIVELCQYTLDRRTRLISFYKVQAQSASNFIMRGSLLAALLIRIFCIVFGGGVLSFILRLLGLGQRLDSHRRLFVETTGLAIDTQSQDYSEKMLQLGINQAFGMLPSVQSKATTVVQGFSETLLAGTWPLVRRFGPMLLLGGLIALPVLLFKFWLLPRQRAQFDKEWKTTTKADIWGSMSRDNPCGGKEGVQSVRFSDVRETRGAN